MLDAHATRAHQIEVIEIDLLIAAWLARVRLGGSGGRDARSRGLPRDQLRRIALRQCLAHSRHRRVKQRALTAQQSIDALSKRQPLIRRQIEVAAQVEQSGLLDCAADTSSSHQALGGVGLAGRAVASLDTPDDHCQMLHQDATKSSYSTKYDGTTFRFSSDTQHPCELAAEEVRKETES